MPITRRLFGFVLAGDDYDGEDTLLNKPLKDGEGITIKWPDDEEEDYNVQIVGDVAYVTIYHHNYPVRMVLRHLNLPVARLSQ